MYNNIFEMTRKKLTQTVGITCSKSKVNLFNFDFKNTLKSLNCSKIFDYYINRYKIISKFYINLGNRKKSQLSEKKL